MAFSVLKLGNKTITEPKRNHCLAFFFERTLSIFEYRAIEKYRSVSNKTYRLSHNIETLSRNLRQPLTKNRPFKNADRRTRHRSSPFRDAQIDIIASKTSQTTDRIIGTCSLDVMTTEHRHDTKGSENDVEWGVDNSVSCPTRLGKRACSV